MAEKKTVSALMPVRDGMPFLPSALRSLQEQTRPLDEILIVDDGSTDGTASFLAREGERDPSIRVLSQPPSGLVVALNNGLQEANGAWVARLDADDVARPDRIRSQLAFLESNPEVAFVGCAYGFIDKNETPFRLNTHLNMQEPARFDPMKDPNVPHQGVMFHRQSVLDVGGYRELVPAEDLDLWLRLAEQCPLGYLDRPLVDVRIRRDGISSSRFIDQRRMWSYARACANARRSGQREPDLDGWSSRNPASSAKRRRWKSEYAIRLAAACWAEGDRTGALASAAKALALHPPSVVKKASRLKRRQ